MKHEVRQADKTLLALRHESNESIRFVDQPSKGVTRDLVGQVGFIEPEIGLPKGLPRVEVAPNKSWDCQIGTY